MVVKVHLTIVGGRAYVAQMRLVDAMRVRWFCNINGRSSPRAVHDEHNQRRTITTHKLFGKTVARPIHPTDIPRHRRPVKASANAEE